MSTSDPVPYRHLLCIAVLAALFYGAAANAQSAGATGYGYGMGASADKLNGVVRQQHKPELLPDILPQPYRGVQLPQHGEKRVTDKPHLHLPTPGKGKGERTGAAADPPKVPAALVADNYRARCVPCCAFVLFHAPSQSKRVKS